MKKLIFFIAIIGLCFIVFLFVYLRPKDYTTKYEINNYEITEMYFKDSKYYYFALTKKDITYDFVLESKYYTKRRLIKKINEIVDTKCILPEIKSVKLYPLCNEDNNQISFSLVNNENLENVYTFKKDNLNFTYNNINVYNTINKNYLIWNYKGFYYINKDTTKEIKLFSRDIYDVSLVAQVNNYLLIPDYDSDYTFTKMYIIDFETGRMSSWELDDEIYFDSYILGVNNKSIFLFDRKTKTEYELVPHKKKMRKVSGRVYQNEWINVSADKLANKNYTFEYPIIYNYQKDTYLYTYYENEKTRTKISNIENPTILFQNNSYLYYLKEDKLYSYNPYQGEILLMKYFEWNFNFENMIFVY